MQSSQSLSEREFCHSVFAYIFLTFSVFLLISQFIHYFPTFHSKLYLLISKLFSDSTIAMTCAAHTSLTLPSFTLHCGVALALYANDYSFLIIVFLTCLLKCLISLLVTFPLHYEEQPWLCSMCEYVPGGAFLSVLQRRDSCLPHPSSSAWLETMCRHTKNYTVCWKHTHAGNGTELDR